MNADEARKIAEEIAFAGRVKNYQDCMKMIEQQARVGKFEAICSIEMGPNEIRSLRNKGYKVEATKRTESHFDPILRDSWTEVVPVYKVSWD